MVRFVMKGGVWKNTEDEILKAAVMKYGKNQWARISSLLVRKSAHQCKARWYEWLDPSIKKTEWTREEEEKLLHLAKLMPTQWRTIAPLVGRTATQCLEHYNKLLDAAQAKDGETTAAKDDPRKLRPGEIDPQPESKPARPDPVDMDEDEKEMLSEARARLANTRGKKAKRKAREKQLDEARRLAQLQKRRELKAAGIASSTLKRKREGEMDYNAEIPFYRKAPAGFFDVPTFEARKREGPFQQQSLQKLEGGRRDDEEEKKRKDDARKQKAKEQKDLPAAIMAINKLINPQVARKRAKLALPSPQISERELEEISRISEEAAEFDRQAHASAGKPTAALLENYYSGSSSVPGSAASATPMRTPLRTPVAKDSVMAEAENLARLTQAQTPLAGGENQPLNPSDFQGATPRRQEMRTPNVLAATVAATPGRAGAFAAATPSATPVRDGLSINAGGNREPTAAEERARRAALKHDLETKLGALPAPKNAFRVSLVEPEAEAPEDHGPEDAADKAAREERELKRREAELRERCSLAMRRGLARPTSAAAYDVPEVDEEEGSSLSPDRLIDVELARVLAFELAHFPPPGFSGDIPEPPEVAGRPPTAAELRDANDLVERELREMRSRALVPYPPDDETFAAAWAEGAESVVFDPASARWVDERELDDAGRVRALKHMIDAQWRRDDDEAARVAKSERRTHVVHAGYLARASSLATAIEKHQADLEQATLELTCFEDLRRAELAGIPQRIKALNDNIQRQTRREDQLQQRYAELVDRLRALQVTAGGSATPS
eukprot:m51a1_g9196 putative cell division cycle 5-like protein (787) ;mRNA; f:96867-99722